MLLFCCFLYFACLCQMSDCVPETIFKFLSIFILKVRGFLRRVLSILLLKLGGYVWRELCPEVVLSGKGYVRKRFCLEGVLSGGVLCLEGVMFGGGYVWLVVHIGELLLVDS